MTTAWYYQRSKFSPVDTTHPEVKKNIAKGKVRVRRHRDKVCFQGPSKRLVVAAIKTYIDQIGFPEMVCMEWPGEYKEVTRRELHNLI